MKTPNLKELVPCCFAVTANSLALALQDWPAQVAASTLKILKEASIRDQNFEQACTFRSAHKALREAIKAAAPSTASKRASRPRSNRGGLAAAKKTLGDGGRRAKSEEPNPRTATPA